MYFLDEATIDGLACGGADILRVIKFIFTLLDAVLFIIPMVLILMLSLDLAKNIIANKDDQMSKNLSLGIKRILFCVVLFLINPIVSFVMDFAGNNGVDFLKCVTIAKTEDLSQYEIEFEEEDFSDREPANITGDKDYEVTGSNGSSSSSTTNTSSGPCGGTYKGTTYNLTEAQLNGIANAVEEEQGTPAGRAAEASLMANRFEMYGSKFGTGGEGLINYIQSSDWFADVTEKAVEKTDSANSETVEIVRDVLVNGNRTIPLYINEHDCFSDIKSATNNGANISIKARDFYQQDVTIIKNTYSSTYNFYCFPGGDSGDPFGYTSDAKKKRGLTD